MQRCVTQLQLCLALETLEETAVVADKIDYEGLQQACIDFAMQAENRWALYHACFSQYVLQLYQRNGLMSA